jgi:hypothetical protein
MACNNTPLKFIKIVTRINILGPSVWKLNYTKFEDTEKIYPSVTSESSN